MASCLSLPTPRGRRIAPICAWPRHPSGWKCRSGFIYVNYSLQGKGTIDTDHVETNESGEAKTTYEAGDEWTKATVSADWTECQQEPEQKTGTADATPICVKDCDGWIAVADLTFNHAGDDIIWTFNDSINLYVDFEVDKKAGTVTGGEAMATHMSTKVNSAREHCSIQGLQTPNFIPGISDGSLDGENVSFKLAAMNTGVNFVWHCEWPNVDPVDTPVPIYATLEAAMMGKFLDLKMPLDCGEFVNGTETDTGTDDATPMTMSYEVSIDCHQRCE